MDNQETHFRDVIYSFGDSPDPDQMGPGQTTLGKKSHITQCENGPKAK